MNMHTNRGVRRRIALATAALVVALLGAIVGQAFASFAASTPGPSASVSGWQLLTAGMTIAPQQYRTWQVDCPSGKKAVGGGVTYWSGAVADARIVKSAPGGKGGNRWVVGVYNDGRDGMTAPYYAWAICARVSL